MGRVEMKNQPQVVNIKGIKGAVYLKGAAYPIKYTAPLIDESQEFLL
jgi:hypothetical protein